MRHGVTTTTINLWAREGRLQKHRYDNVRRCLYEPLDKGAILKGPGRPSEPNSQLSPLRKRDEVQYET